MSIEPYNTNIICIFYNDDKSYRQSLRLLFNMRENIQKDLDEIKALKSELKAIRAQKRKEE